jgi:hypothetical protein
VTDNGCDIFYYIYIYFFILEGNGDGKEEHFDKDCDEEGVVGEEEEVKPFLVCL